MRGTPAERESVVEGESVRPGVVPGGRWITQDGLFARLVCYGVCCVRGWRRL
eukprot:COSAG06_NODE_30750_length_533_cov_0.629032_2_plen_51_part_01